MVFRLVFIVIFLLGSSTFSAELLSETLTHLRLSPISEDALRGISAEDRAALVFILQSRHENSTNAARILLTGLNVNSAQLVFKHYWGAPSPKTGQLLEPFSEVFQNPQRVVEAFEELPNLEQKKEFVRIVVRQVRRSVTMLPRPEGLLGRSLREIKSLVETLSELSQELQLGGELADDLRALVGVQKQIEKGAEPSSLSMVIDTVPEHEWLVAQLLASNVLPGVVEDVKKMTLSTVLIGREWVLKVYRPRAFGFWSGVALNDRWHTCEEEVRLGERTTDKVYEAVLPIYWTSHGISFTGPGKIVDYAVRMRRLPSTNTLESILQRHALPPEMVTQLGREIGKFERSASRNSLKAQRHSADWLASLISRDIDEVATHNDVFSSELLERLRKALLCRISFVGRVLDERRAEVREGHGDLKLDSIYVEPIDHLHWQFQMLDPMNLNADFRFVDPVQDIAFLMAQFEFEGVPKFRDSLWASFIGEMQDPTAERVLPFYLGQRHLVFAIVKSASAAHKSRDLAEKLQKEAVRHLERAIELWMTNQVEHS